MGSTLVGPTGTDLGGLMLEVENSLKKFGYESKKFSATDLFQVTREDEYNEVKKSGEYKRISEFMNWGNQLREESGSNDFLAKYLVSRIAKFREKKRDSIPRRAFILKSLKHPDEVNTLRYLYKDSFYLIGLWADESSRKQLLRGHKKINSQKDIEDLIQRDKDEAFDYGQKQVKTFHLADIFVQASPIEMFRSQIDRFLNLLFGHPFVTPSWDEHCMFLSYAAALRSTDLSRQVGAVIISKRGDVISQGCNEVPKSGGGQYKNNDEPDERDFQKGYDSNEIIRNEIAQSILDEIINNESLSENLKETRSQDVIKEILKKSTLKDLTEFSRALHAEMECLLSAGRNGNSVVGGTMYVTTFPCHNCAKHIVASGLKKVIYIEPYPKSRASELHEDSISLDIEKPKHVQFLPFIGLGPRKYFDLFSTQMSTGCKVSRKDNSGKAARFEALLQKTIKPRLYSVISSYEDREKELVASFDKKLECLKDKKENH